MTGKGQRQIYAYEQYCNTMLFNSAFMKSLIYEVEFFVPCQDRLSRNMTAQTERNFQINPADGWILNIDKPGKP